MKPFIAYYTKTGNTRKVAEKMASALKTKAHNVKDEPKVPKGAFLIVGSGVYGRRSGREMMDFLQALPKVKAGKAATFETSGEGSSIQAGREMGEILKNRGYSIKGSFVCPGKLFYVLRRGRPSGQDMENAKKFAEGLKKK